MKIIGISGKRGSGKTLLAKSLEKYGYIRMSLAYELKAMAYEQFGLSNEQTYGHFKETPTHYKDKETGKYFTPREILIRLGAFYRTIDEDYWLKRIERNFNYSKKFVIDDIRFINEIEYLKKKYAATFVRLERLPELNIYKTELNDISETELDKYKEWAGLLLPDFNKTPEDIDTFAEYIVAHE